VALQKAKAYQTEVSTLTIGSRPTSGCFLSPDLSKGGLQTRRVVATKRIRQGSPVVNIVEGSELARAVAAILMGVRQA
jgi:hypothetical protein